MEWKKVFTKSQWLINSILLLTMGGLVMASLYAFKMRNLEKHRLEKENKIRSTLEHLKSAQHFSRYVKLSSQGKLNQGSELIHELNSKLVMLEELLELRVSPELRQQLKTFENQNRTLKVSLVVANQELQNWLVEAEKKALLMNNANSSERNTLILILCSVMAFLGIAWIGLAYAFRWLKTVIMADLESEVKKVVLDGVTNGQRFMLDGYSDDTRSEIIQLLDRIKVRLELGTLLDEGIPFAGCLINQDLKLLWHNRLLMEQFSVGEEVLTGESFNWDLLKGLLHLSQDPIQSAIKEQIGGIYPVKLMQDEQATAQPFEMYVTPVSVSGETAVMVFFYPLISLQDALKDQLNEANLVIERMLGLWYEERLDQEQLKLLEMDFKHQNLLPLFKILSETFQHHHSNAQDSKIIISQLETQQIDLLQELETAKNREVESTENFRSQAKGIQHLRECFITALEQIERFRELNKIFYQQLDDFKSEANRLNQLISSNQQQSRETMEMMQQLENLRNDTKKLKFDFLDIKTRLVTFHAGLISQLPVLDDNQQKIVHRYQDELARLDVSVALLEKKLSQLDLLVGKSSLVGQSRIQEQVNFKFSTGKQDHELREAIQTVQDEIAESENHILEQFHHLQKTVKKGLRHPSTEGAANESLYS